MRGNNAKRPQEFCEQCSLLLPEIAVFFCPSPAGNRHKIKVFQITRCFFDISTPPAGKIPNLRHRKLG